MKILLMSVALGLMSFTPITVDSNDVVEAPFACTVTLDCGNGSSSSGTAATCRQAGAIAGAGCDAAIEMASVE